MSITKRNIADALAKKFNINRSEALIITNEFFEKIKAAIINEGEIKISNFGNFRVKEKTARPGRNPKTGEEVVISARKVVTFKASPKLKLITNKSK